MQWQKALAVYAIQTAVQYEQRSFDLRDKALVNDICPYTLSLQYTNLETDDITTEPISTKFFVDFADIFDSSVEVENGVTTYTCDEYTLHLTPMTTDYGKEYTFVVSVNDFKKSPSWDNNDTNNNNQLLTMTFVYKNPLL